MRKPRKTLSGMGPGVFRDPRDVYEPRITEVPRSNGYGINYENVDRGSRRIADYCGIVAKKTSRIGRNFGNFIQAQRGHLMANRRNDQNERFPSVTSNRIVPRADYLGPGTSSDRSFHEYSGLAESSQERIINEKSLGTRVIEKYRRNIDFREYRERNRDFTRTESHAVMRLDRVQYEHQKNPARGKNRTRRRAIELEDVSNGYEASRLYSSLPKRGFSRYRHDYDLMGDPRARSIYPKSMQDLTDLDIERMLERDTNFRIPLSLFRSSDSLVERYRRYENDEDSDDNYLTLYKSLSNGLEEDYREKSYVPGRVHYEREYRIYGKDTVALIYYKTCYL